MTRAVVIEEFGGPEVLVRVKASGTNPVEAKIRQGKTVLDLT